VRENDSADNRNANATALQIIIDWTSYFRVISYEELLITCIEASQFCLHSVKMTASLHFELGEGLPQSYPLRNSNKISHYRRRLYYITGSLK